MTPVELILQSGPSPASLTVSGTSGAGGTFVLRRQGVADRSSVELTLTASSGTLVKTQRIRILLQQGTVPAT